MLKERLKKINGQSLIEILIGISIAAILIGGAAATIALTLRSNVQNKNLQSATSLSQELLDQLASFSEANWHNVYSLAKGEDYHLPVSGSGFSAVAGMETLLPIDGTAFIRKFSVENVSRDPVSGNIESSYNAANDDPSTQKIVVTTSWTEQGQSAFSVLSKYLIRSKNLVFHQTDWSGGGGQPGPVTTVNNKYDTASGVQVNNPVGSVKKTP